MRFETFLKWLSAEICALAGLLWGGMDGLLFALLTVMCLDFATGLIVGGAQRKLNSEVCFRGLAKKMLILVMVALGHVLDAHIFGGSAAVCRSAVIGFYVANEGLSILENAGKLGMPFPKRLRQMLEQLKNEEDDDDGE
ncbi:MAG: phage holin family protein [Oscillospiraceae bacterium]|nr:phage holin family protein [Oscillospiraceae bacterium]